MPFLVLFIIIYLPIERSIFKKSPYVKANNIKVKDEYDLFITNSFRFIIKNQKHKYNLRYNYEELISTDLVSDNSEVKLILLVLNGIVKLMYIDYENMVFNEERYISFEDNKEIYNLDDILNKVKNLYNNYSWDYAKLIIDPRNVHTDLDIDNFFDRYDDVIICESRKILKGYLFENYSNN